MNTTRHSQDDDQFARLSVLDPLAGFDLDAAHQAQAERALAAILADASAPVDISTFRRRPVAVRRATRAVAMIGVASLALVGADDLTGNDAQRSTAWAAVPSVPPSTAVERAVDACRDLPSGEVTAHTFNSDGSRGPDEVITNPDFSSAVVLLSESRGGVVTVVVQNDDQQTATCMADEESSSWMSAGTTSEPSELGPREIVVQGSGDVGVATDPVASLSGAVGDEVVGIVLHTTAQEDVTATIAGGHFSAWWPGPEWGVENFPTPLPATVTYADGSTAEVSIGVDLTPQD